MKCTQFVVGMLAVLIVTTISFGQPRRMFEGRGSSPERLERFKTMRLVEVLKLSEEDAVRFYSKQSAHEDKIHDLMKSRNEAIDDLAEMARSKSETNDIGKRIDQVSDLDQKMFAERQRYQEDMRKFLTPEQFAKFLVFERSFGRNVHDAMREMHRDR